MGMSFNGEAVSSPFPVANTESCFSSDALLHEGHAAVRDPLISISKRLLQALQTYSNIGIFVPLFSAYQLIGAA
jgi:hypothetical protein